MHEQPERPNWADWGFFLLLLPRAVLLHLYRATVHTQSNLMDRSRIIDARRRFERKVLADINALPGGDE